MKTFSHFQPKTTTFPLPYLLTRPEGYDDVPLPMIVFLHGAGERGDNEARPAIHGIPLYFSKNEAHIGEPVITLSPQCPDGEIWSNFPAAIMELILAVAKEQNADMSRISITGISMGGFGTWDMLARHGDMFAGAIAICGGGDPSQADSLKDIPIYVVHGTNDPTVPFSGSQGMVTAIENAGGELIEFDIRQGANHFVWDYVGDSTDIAKWLFSQSKE